MISITFVDIDDNEKVIQAEEGLNLMEVAIRNNIAGIVGECGGQCSCATCHVYIEDEYFEKVGAPVDDEEDMLDFSEKRQPNSRLGCQVTVAAELEGMTVRAAGED